MKRRIILCALITTGIFLIALAGLAGCAAQSGAEGTVDTGAPVRFLSIEGDVEQNIIHNTATPVANDAALPGDKDFEGVPLTEFVAQAGISGTPQTLYLLSSGDGFISSIDYANAKQVYVVFSATKGWCVIAPGFPPPANGTDIDRVIVVSEDSKVGLPVARADGSTTLIPMGQLLLAPQRAVLRLDGTSVNTTEGGERAVSLYTRQYSVALADVDEAYEGVGFVVVTDAGETFLTDGGGRFVLYRQAISYQETTGDIYEGVAEIRLR